jgi:hypothetical protein
LNAVESKEWGPFLSQATPRLQTSKP